MKGFKNVHFESNFLFDLVKPKKAREVERQLRWFVENNDFYDIQKDSDGVMYFSYLPIVKYKIDKDKLIVSFCLDGSAMCENYLKLENRLSFLFDMNCSSVEVKRGCVYYTFVYDSYYEPLKVDIDTDLLELTDNEEIRLNNFLTWKYKKVPHALICGNTGSGKTYFTLYLIKCLFARNFDLKVIDAKKSSLSRYARNLRVSVASEDSEIVSLLHSVRDEMNRRYTDAETMDVSMSTLNSTPLFVVFDEVASFMGGSIDRKTKDECMKLLREIILKGREANVFMILTMQKPMSEFISTDIRDQLGLRVALGKMSDTGRTMVFGSEWGDMLPRFSGVGCGMVYIDTVTDKPTDFKAPRLEDAWVI